VQPWVKSVLLVLAAMILVAGVGVAFSRLTEPAPKPSPRQTKTTTADAVLQAADPQIGEVATATIGPANEREAPGYFEARVLGVAESKPEWMLANWGPANEQVGPERVDTQEYGSATPAQRWIIFHFADGSALRVGEVPAAVGGLLNAWRVGSVEVTRP
jgi:hypothetical protein